MCHRSKSRLTAVVPGVSRSGKDIDAIFGAVPHEERVVQRVNDDLRISCLT